MDSCIKVLLGLAGLAFLAGTLGRFLFDGQWLGNEPVVFWRGAMGFLAFAIALILLQIRDARR